MVCYHWHMMTEAEYVAIRSEFIDLTVALAKAGKFREPNTRMDELKKLMYEFATSTPVLYKITCVKEHYAGQGISWNLGDEYGSYYVLAEAEETLKNINKGWSLDCWEMTTIPNDKKI